MPAYNEAFPAGVKVRVKTRSELEQFQREWTYHHPIEGAQLEYAGAVAEVLEVGFYHGGDALYTLAGLPGLWHAECLESAGIN